MKVLLFTLILLTSFAHGNAINFKKDLLPLIQQDKSTHLLFQNFDFHPTYVYRVEGKHGEHIFTIVSYSPDENGSAVWSHFVTFSLATDKAGKKSISSVSFSSCSNESQPCFMPKEVYSIDKDKKLVVHQMGYTPLKINKDQLKNVLPFSQFKSSR